MDQPARIGKYEIEQFLGGGMSQVYRARDTLIGRTVAIKILKEQAANDPDAKARFLREAQLAGSLSHENILGVYDFGEEQGKPFMVMEFLKGEDLRHALANGHAGDTANRIRIAIQVAKALEYVHSQNIIHRDIKPDNIHLSSTGTVKLMDFGIAKTQELSLTRTGYTLGTPYYMAPEQVTGQQVAKQADVYAFGILLFEMMTGTKPFSGETVEQLFFAILNTPVDIARVRGAGAPEALCTLIERCTAKKPSDRPADFHAVRAALEELAGGTKKPNESSESATITMAKPAAGRGTNPLVIAAIAGVLVALAGAYFLFRPHTQGIAPAAPAALAPVLNTPSGEMVLVSKGKFLAGADKRTVDAGNYYIDRTEVTNAAYAQFCKDRQRPLPPGFVQDHPDYPVVNLTIVDAQEFAKWAGKRLPNRYEWEKAARGTDGRGYPWGNDRDPSRANVADNPSRPAGARALVAVTDYAQAESPYHALQMAGNAWEFVDELITPSPGALQAFAKLMSPPPAADEPWYTIRGGAFDVPLIENVTAEWSAVPARYRAPNIGFRCVKDAP